MATDTYYKRYNREDHGQTLDTSFWPSAKYQFFNPSLAFTFVMITALHSLVYLASKFLLPPRTGVRKTLPLYYLLFNGAASTPSTNERIRPANPTSVERITASFPIPALAGRDRTITLQRGSLRKNQIIHQPSAIPKSLFHAEYPKIPIMPLFYVLHCMSSILCLGGEVRTVHTMGYEIFGAYVAVITLYVSGLWDFIGPIAGAFVSPIIRVLWGAAFRARDGW